MAKRTIKRPAKKTTIGMTAIKRAVKKVGTSRAKKEGNEGSASKAS